MKRVDCGRARVNGTSLFPVRYADEAASVDLGMDYGNGERVRIERAALLISGADLPLRALEAEGRLA